MLITRVLQVQDFITLCLTSGGMDRHRCVDLPYPHTQPPLKHENLAGASSTQSLKYLLASPRNLAMHACRWNEQAVVAMIWLLFTEPEQLWMVKELSYKHTRNATLAHQICDNVHVRQKRKASDLHLASIAAAAVAAAAARMQPPPPLQHDNTMTVATTQVTTQQQPTHT
jgi:hypothetical protein